MKPILFISLTLLFISNSFSQKNIPNKNLENLQGQTVNIHNEITKDKITVLSFWATWCIPCLNELDAIDEVYEDWQEETNVELIAISTDDARSQKRVKALVNGKGWEYKVLLDKNQELKRALNINTVPEVLVVKNGKVIYRHSGYAPGFEDKLFQILKENAL